MEWAKKGLDHRTKKHLLIDVIGLGICGVIAGAQAWTEIEDFCHPY